MSIVKNADLRVNFAAGLFPAILRRMNEMDRETMNIVKAIAVVEANRTIEMDKIAESLYILLIRSMYC